MSSAQRCATVLSSIYLVAQHLFEVLCIIWFIKKCFLELIHFKSLTFSTIKALISWNYAQKDFENDAKNDLFIKSKMEALSNRANFPPYTQ